MNKFKFYTLSNRQQRDNWTLLSACDFQLNLHRPGPGREDPLEAGLEGLKEQAEVDRAALAVSVGLKTKTKTSRGNHDIAKIGSCWNAACSDLKFLGRLCDFPPTGSEGGNFPLLSLVNSRQEAAWKWLRFSSFFVS